MKTSYRDLDYAYGNAMQKLRNTIGLTQAALANRLGVSWRTVAGWEAGSSYPRAERLKELIAFAVQQQAFSVGHEAEEIRVLWKVTHQKTLLDEHWLTALLDQQSRPQEQAQRLQPRVEPESVEETSTTAQITEQEPADEELTELGTLSDQSSLVRSLHVTGLDAVACQPQRQSHERPPAVTPLALEAETTGTPPTSLNGSFPQTPSQTKADQPRSKWLIGIVITLVILAITGAGAMLLFQAIAHRDEQAQKAIPDQTHSYPSYLPGNGQLSFFDSLSQKNGSRWSSNDTDFYGASCLFTGGAYHVGQQPGHRALCPIGGTFSNFAFEVQSTITQGDCGGISFSQNIANPFLYYFDICQDGTYMINKYVLHDTHSIKTRSSTSSSSAIHTGTSQQNKIALVASGRTMTFYVNEQKIDQVQESSNILVEIALVAVPFDLNGHTTDVAYSNARLWRL